MGDELLELIVKKESNIENVVDATAILNAVLNNKKKEIDWLLKRSTAETLKQKHRDYGNKPITLIACTNENVTKDTLNSFCESIKSHYNIIDCFDDDWYKWEPLHYVTRMADPEKLQVLLNHNVPVNSLTTFSENALHILLEYQQCAKPYTTLLYKGPDSKECVIVNTEKENILKCAKLLIQAGIDINHSNLWNETPICIAVRYRYIQITELLLKIPSIDLDSYKEGSFKIREYIKENYIYQGALPQSNIFSEDPVTILFDFLKSGDEEAFIEFNNGNIKEHANSIDGDREFNSSGNMLQFCFKKGYLEYLQHELYGEELTKSDIMDNLMLRVFCSKGLGRCIEHLLSNGADPHLTYRKFPQTLLEAAAVVGYYPLVALLLQHSACRITSAEIFEILPKLYETRHNLTNHEYYRKYVLSILLNKLISLKGRTILSSRNLDILNNILHRLNLECDDEREDDSENICQILKLGASLTRRVEDNKMIIQCIHLETLRLHFDDCIENNILYYNSIIEDAEDGGYSETRALQFLANDIEKSELLRHPLLIHFLHNKWLRNFYFFYLDLFLYFVFLISIYAYMISAHQNRNFDILNILFFVLLLTHFVKECIQLLLYRLKYFLDTSNYLELTIIVCSFINMFYYNVYCAVLAILFSTVIFVTLLGQVPICAKYTIIFGSTKYFLQYASFYFIQFVGFAFIFYIIFPFPTNTKNVVESNITNADPLENDVTDTVGDLLKSLFYTLVLFTGEFGDRVLEPERFPIFGRIIMTTFIFCMTIILNNLLVGLIVADMDEMQRVGKLYKQVKIANFISRMNSIVKRLYEFNNIRYIKTIINKLHIFRERENKFLDLTKCKHKSVFDDENLKYLKSIRNRKNIAYDKELLKNVYILIQEKKLENQNEKRT